MPASQRDIAQKLGISVSAVSMALRNSPRISTEMRQQVQALASELGYQTPHAEAGHIRQIAFVTPYQVDNAFFADILKGAEAECRAQQVMLRYTLLDRFDQPKIPAIREEEGILMVGEVDKTAVEKLQTLGVPLVLVEYNLPHLGLDRVLIENYGAMLMLAHRLVNLGHTRVLYLTGRLSVPSFRERLQGFQDGAQELGLTFETLSCQDADVNSSELAVQGWIATPNHLDASVIVASNDHLAVGAMYALQQAGLRVPMDISVVGFDDLPLAKEVRPSLTTIRVPREQMGRLAVRRLLKQAQTPEETPYGLVLYTEWVERDSLRAI